MKPTTIRGLTLTVIVAILILVAIDAYATEQTDTIERDFFEPGTLHFIDGTCIDTNGEWGLTAADTCWTPTDHNETFGVDVPVGWERDRTFTEYVGQAVERVMTPAQQEARQDYAYRLRLEELEEINAAMVDPKTTARTASKSDAVPETNPQPSLRSEEAVDLWLSRHVPPSPFGDTKRGAARSTSGGASAYSPVTPGVEQWRDLVARYDWPVEEALAVMACESNGVATARRPGGTDSGLFQILRLWWGPAGVDPFDPEQNVELAYAIWLGGHPRAGEAPNWGMWVCFAETAADGTVTIRKWGF